MRHATEWIFYEQEKTKKNDSGIDNAVPLQTKPPGLVIFPSGEFLVVGGRHWKDRCLEAPPLTYLPFREGVDPAAVTVIPRLYLNPDQVEQLREAFITLRMLFPVRCRHASCAMEGPLREIFQNNLLIPGKSAFLLVVSDFNTYFSGVMIRRMCL